jgi:hypothetical protein
MKSRLVSLGIAAMAFALASPAVLGQTLYKLIDKNGKITYSEKEPKNFDGKVIRMDIDPNANTATLPKLPPPAAAESKETRINKEGDKSKPASVQEARDRLDRAKQAYDRARDNPGEGEVAWIGNAGGGTRAIPSADYQKRLAGLEAEVKRAEEDLKRAEGG